MNWRITLLSFVRRANLRKIYNENIKIQYQGTAQSILSEMDKKAWDIFYFHLKNNKGYRQFLMDKGMDISQPSLIKWEDIPFMCKADYKNYNMEVKAEVYRHSSSGGSTSSPLKFALSKRSELSLWPNHWMLHNNCGQEPCGKILMLMGHHSQNWSLLKRAYYGVMNIYNVFSLDMTDENAKSIVNLINTKGIKIIYGYSTCIYQFLKFLEKENIHLSMKGIISTSENRILKSYELAKKYCSCELYDQYGAHDGDIFSFECSAHKGLHFLHNKSKVEIIENNEIVLTASENTAFPFIRYKVGDIASGPLITEKCECGRTLLRIPGIDGRSNVFITDTDGKKIPVIMFTMPLDEDYKIDKYQVVELDGKVMVNIITDYIDDDYYKNKHLSYMKRYLKRDIKLVFNQPLYKLKNDKTPLFYTDKKVK